MITDCQCPGRKQRGICGSCLKDNSHLRELFQNRPLKYNNYLIVNQLVYVLTPLDLPYFRHNKCGRDMRTMEVRFLPTHVSNARNEQTYNRTCLTRRLRRHVLVCVGIRHCISYISYMHNVSPCACAITFHENHLWATRHTHTWRNAKQLDTPHRLIDEVRRNLRRRPERDDGRSACWRL